MKNISNNINFIRKTLEQIENISETVKIVAVTKGFPSEDILKLFDCGIYDIGESKIQEALPKFDRLGDALSGKTKHFIGHLQSNKAKRAVMNFDLIQSLDSLKLAKNISRHAQEINKVQDCLIEVKVSDEISKTGIAIDHAEDFYDQCLEIPNILIKGLMVIAPLSEKPEDSRKYFKNVRRLFEHIKNRQDNRDFNILSMGMSDDYQIAVEEGANMVRIGSAIFGERDYGNK